MSARVKRLVEQLAAIDLDNVFNPYADVCRAHDDTESPLIRRKNLEHYINGALAKNTSTAWIGRDLGYRGGRRTGLPLTDEARLETFSESFDAKCVKKATTTEAVAERTAAEIWRVLSELEVPPFLWNAFPLHPHEPNEQLSNRCHSRKEFLACSHILSELIEIFQFKKIYALGNDAARALEPLDVEVVCIRHPSYGGQTEFRRQMAMEYHLRERQAELAFH